MSPTANTFDNFPNWLLTKWQNIADLLAELIGIPAALIMKTENEYMEVFISSHSENNPYHVGEKEHWHGLYCETVIKTQTKLSIPNATKDPKWDKNPDIKLGMIAYLGFPINFPDNQPFGTLCVLDNKERPFTLLTEKLLVQFTHVIELDLALIQSYELRTNQLAATVAQEIAERKRAEEERQKLQAQFIQAQKMEAVGRLASGVAHDFNNKLGIILGYVEMAFMQLSKDQPISEHLNEIKTAAIRSADLTRQLLAFARKQTAAPKVLDINKTIESMTSMLRRLIGEDIDLAWLPGNHVWSVCIDPAQVDQVLANLCVNARDAIAGVGKVTIETHNATFDEAYCAIHTDCAPGEYVLLAVSDNGCGMDAETREKIFEPFFTTKEQGKGTGLGLATVHGVVKQNNGFINVYSEPGQGTTFRIYLPRHMAKAIDAEEPKLQAAAAGGETILLVEDEPANLKMTTMLLERLGYRVLAAPTPGEAIRLCHGHAGRIDLLLADVVMPEMNGLDLAKNILLLYPDIRRLFMSGYTANVLAHQGVLGPGVHFLEKPFSMQELGAKIREALGNG